MDIFTLFFVFIFGWIIFRNVKAAGKRLNKAAKADAPWRENISTMQARLEKHAARDEFDVSPELKREWKDDAFGGQWTDKTPTQRGHETLQKRVESASTRQTRQRKHSQKTKHPEHKRGEDYGLSSRHAPQKDQNRHRREDWGSRGSGELLTTKSLLVILALGLIAIYVLSKISPSDLGL